MSWSLSLYGHSDNAEDEGVIVSAVRDLLAKIAPAAAEGSIVGGTLTTSFHGVLTAEGGQLPDAPVLDAAPAEFSQNQTTEGAPPAE